MILGIGMDLCLVERIRRSIRHFGTDWLEEVFTDREQAALGLKSDVQVEAAMGFALKEACSKALGTGFADGVTQRDFEVSFAANRPSVRVLNGGARRAFELCPVGLDFGFQCEVRGDATWALAMAILHAGEIPHIDLTSLISSSAGCVGEATPSLSVKVG